MNSHDDTPLDIDSIQARAEAATEAMDPECTDWVLAASEADWADERDITIGPDCAPPVALVYEGIALAEFLASAITDVPALVAALRERDAEVRALRAKVAEVRRLAHLDRKCPCCTGYGNIIAATEGTE